MDEEITSHVRYLGDGLYADFDGHNVELYASNGMFRTDRVFLDPHVLSEFQRWLKDRSLV